MRLNLLKFYLGDLRYLRNPKFARASFLLGIFYLFCNPYRYCRKFLEKRGAEEVHAYGETPLTTLEKIACKAKIGKDDLFLELGSGRGKNALWMGAHVGCQVIGIEWIERFAKRASWAAIGMKNVSFIHADVLDVSFEGATVIYLYGSSWNEELICRLAKKIPVGAKIISISFPLSGFTLLEEFPVAFPWGNTSAYLLAR